MSHDNEHSGCIFTGCLSILVINFVVWSLGVFQVIKGIGYFYYKPPNDFGVSTLILFGIGLFQLLYVFPLLLIFRHQRKWQFLKGLIVGTVLTAIMNAIGLVIFFTS